jgi:hypothetical protein
MTADQLAQGLDASEQEDTDSQQRGIPVQTILSICDRLLGEVGRRRHMFAWLRVPAAAAGEWLPVDAYYPRARLVVMCRPQGGEHEALYREQVPAHGLGLLRLDPDKLGDDEAAVETALAARIFDLEHTPRPAPAASRPQAAAVRPEPAPARPDDGAMAAEAPAPEWTPVKVERMAVAPAVEQGVGLLVGLALAGVLIAEIYLAVVRAAFGAGRVLLGFAIALEACSRALGTGAAARAGERVWACACAIGGAPVVAWFAFLRPSGRVEVEPAPLAGLLAGLAGVVAILALLFGT